MLLNLPLERKLPLLISALVLLVLVAATGAAYLEVERSTTLAASQRLSSVTKQLAELSRTGVTTRKAALRSVAGDSVIHRLLRSSVAPPDSLVQNALRRLYLPPESVLVAGVWDRSGHVVATSGVASGAIDDRPRLALTGEAAADRARRNDSAQVGRFYAHGDSVFFWTAAPVMEHGALLGFVAQRRRIVSQAQSDRQIRELIGQDISVFVGNEVNDLRTTLAGAHSQPPAELRAASGVVTFDQPGAGEQLATVSRVAGTPWIIEAEMPRSTVLARPYAFLRRMSLVAAVLLLAGAIIAWLLSREVTRPLADLTTATEALARGEYDHRVEITRGDELGRLSDAFNIMAERVASSRTALERQTAAAESARSEAVAASQAKSDFLAVMSHELRTPLNAILGFSSLLMDDVTGPVTEPQRAQLTRIRAGGQHLLALIDEILTLSRLEAQREEVRVDDGDACAIARETASLAEPMALAKGLRLVAHLPETSCIVRTDLTKLRQIVLNLISNAIKFTNEGEVSVKMWSEPDEIVLEVNDSGIGIAPDAIDRIFEPFYQVEQSKSRRAAGTGLGLTVTRHLVRLLGGDITVTSTVGTGSTFVVRLPCVAPSDKPELAQVGTADSTTG
ncbi:MAG: HAMP domain-containing histidine kinase [Gemmatimonadota bacterium]|nr:HAMP domain-containing histidine kinase [Gemmatimonadota bacterium]